MKRFTETAKWGDPWFLNLSLDSKLAFWYITENCDGAGVWDPNYRLANFCLNRDVDWLAVQREFGDRLVILVTGKWWLTKFVAFQYGELSEACKPHAKVMSLLNTHGIKRVSKGYKYPIHTQQEEEEDKEEEEDRGGAGGNRGHEEQPDLIEPPAVQLFRAYPRRVGKEGAVKAIERALKAHPFERLMAAVTGYAGAVSRWPVGERKYVPYPASWFNDGRFEDDPKEWEKNDRHPNQHQAPAPTSEDHARGFFDGIEKQP